MEIPNWLKWVAVVGLVIWLVTDPRGMAAFVGGIWTGIKTFFGELG